MGEIGFGIKRECDTKTILLIVGEKEQVGERLEKERESGQMISWKSVCVVEK